MKPYNPTQIKSTLIYCICEDCAEEWVIERKCLFWNIRDICELCGEEQVPVMDETFWYERMEEILIYQAEQYFNPSTS